MKIWDISPGYLNDQALQDEHLSLQRVAALDLALEDPRHPEAIRWLGHDGALNQRQRQVASELALRGLESHWPRVAILNEGSWPTTYLEDPGQQFALLSEAHPPASGGRIPLPTSTQQLWSQHKYSIMARDPSLYRELGRELAERQVGFAELALRLTEWLRITPGNGGIRNAVQHMWGYVSETPPPGVEHWTCRRLLEETQRRAIDRSAHYLLASTALSELMSHLDDG